MAGIGGTSIVYDQSVIRFIAEDKIVVVSDPITGKYTANHNYQVTMEKIFNAMAEGKPIPLRDGRTVDLTSTTGALLLNGDIIRTETIQSLTGTIPDIAQKYITKAMTLL